MCTEIFVKTQAFWKSPLFLFLERKKEKRRKNEDSLIIALTKVSTERATAPVYFLIE
jgi:hypothetical protein